MKIFWNYITLLLLLGQDAAADGVYNSTHVVTGDDTRLSCSASIENSVSWQHIPRGNKHRTTVTDGKDLSAEYGNKTRFSLDIDAASRQYDLLIRRVDLSDAGMYYCKHGTSETSVDLSVQKTKEQNLKIGPINSAAFVGSEVRLNCSTSIEKPVFWKHVPCGESESRDVYVNGVLIFPYASNPGYKVDTDVVTGQYDLVISNVQYSDAGRFTCIDDEGFGSEVSAELIVLEMPLQCSSGTTDHRIVVENDCGLKPDILNMACVTSFVGNVEPGLKLRHGDVTYKSILVSQKRRNFATIISTFTIQPTYSMIQQPLTCELSGLPPIPIDNWCSFPKLNITYVFNSTWISYHRNIFHYMDQTRISCMANSSESCSYKWYETDNPSKIVSQDQHVDLVDLPDGRYQCLAECFIGSSTCSFQSKPIDVGSPECSLLSVIIMSCSWTAAGLILFVFVIIIVKRKSFAYILAKWAGIPFTDAIPLMPQGNIEYREVCMQRVTVITQLRGNPKSLNTSNSTNNENKFPYLKSILTIFDRSGKLKDDTELAPMNDQEGTTNEVRGLAVLENNIYIVRANEKTIEQYNCDTCAYIKSISVKYLSMVRDMVSCSRYKFLYICDEDNNTIHRIRIPRIQNSIARRHIESWPMSHKPESMSVTPEGDLVVTCLDDLEILIYNSKGYLKRKFIPPGNPWHALQLQNNRFVVFHKTSGEHPSADIISLVSDRDGNRPVFQGEGNIGLRKGRLAATNSEFIFATDYENSRVLLLDPELKLVDGSLISEIQHPSRICFDEQRQRMYVAVENNTKDVYVYKLFPKPKV